MTALLLTTLGCSGTAPNPSPLPLAEYDAELPQMPAVSLYRLRPEQALVEKCEAFNARSERDYCTIQNLNHELLRDALIDTTAFESVSLADDSNPYALAVIAASYKAALKVEAQLYWFNQRLEHFRIDLTSASPDSPATAQSIATHLVRDLQNNGSFSTEKLHTTLQSTAYRSELQAAPTIGDFSYAGMQVLHNPSYGASLRYVHDVYEGAYLDVFVYPVADWRYRAALRLDEEISGLREDLIQLEAQGLWKNLKLNEVIEQNQPMRVMSFDGEYRNADDQLLATTAHIYISGDKFVKVRASYPKFAPVRDTIDRFVDQLPGSLTVPSESPFMARVRKSWQAADRAHPEVQINAQEDARDETQDN